MAKILIIEDDPDIVLALEEDLRNQGHETANAADGETGLRLARKGPWDLILLDLMLPRMDGFDVCRSLRESGIRTPLLMLTARSHEAEKILGFELGADDFVTKPYSARELRARIKAMLRRNVPPSESRAKIGGCEVDFDRAELTCAGQTVDVTALELRILRAFLRRPGRVFTRAEIIEDAWGGDIFVADRVVDTHILNLRKKIEPDPSGPRFLRSVRGIGYRFDP